MRASYVGDVSVWDDEDLPHLIGVVAAYVRRRVTAGAADDIVGTVFVKAVAATNRPGAAPRQVEPWLLSIARNAVIDHYRARATEHRTLQQVELTAQATVPPPTVDDDPVLGRALARLGIRDRELLLLVGWEQLSHGEIARVLSCSRATVAVRLHRARGRLRDALLEEQLAEDPPPHDLTVPGRHGTRRLRAPDGSRSQS